MACAGARFDGGDERFVIAKVVCGDGAVNRLAVGAIHVLRGYVGGDRFALSGVGECGPRNGTSTSSVSGLAVSGRNAVDPRMPGRSS